MALVQQLLHVCCCQRVAGVHFTHCCTGTVAFVAGATAAVGSSVVKVPLAVCVRSVQARLYPNPFAAARSLVETAGVRSLFTVTFYPFP